MTLLLFIAAAAVLAFFVYLWATDGDGLGDLFDGVAGLFGSGGGTVGEPGGLPGGIRLQAMVALAAATALVLYASGEGTSLATMLVAIVALALVALVLFNVMMVLVIRRLLGHGRTGGNGAGR